MSDEPLRVAVAGLGAIGAIHARNAMASEHMRLVAVASSHARRVGDHAAALGGGVVGSTVDRLLNEVDVDLVIVASQTADHLAYARPQLERGRHVFLEKPGAVTLNEHAELTDLAARSGSVVVTGYVRRYDPDFAGLKRLVDDGAVGEPVHVSLVARKVVVPPAARDQAGGFIVDLGVHHLRHRGLDPRPGAGGGPHSRPAGGAAAAALRNAVITVRFDRGAIAHVHLSCTSAAGQEVRCEVVGTAESVALNGLAEGVPSLVPLDGGSAAAAPRDFADRFEYALRAELDAFVAACAGDPGHTAGLIDDQRALAVGVAARASAERRRPLAVGPDRECHGLK